MSISVDGLISGMDTTSIVKQIMDLERRPINLLKTKQATLVEQKTAWQEINTRMLSLETSAKGLNTSGLFNTRSALFHTNNSLGGTVLSVSSGPDAVDGTFNIVVTQLASAEKSASNEGFTSATTAASASGTITINDGTAYNISVTSTDTLTNIRDNINNSGANVTATVFNAGTTASPAYKLVVTGSSTGSANGFTITDITNLTFSETQTAQDASFTLDGISVTKDSNTVSDVINDVTLSLETVGSGSVTFSADYTALVAKIQTFADSYNEVTDYMNEQFSYDQGKNSKGPLFGNMALLSMQSQIRGIVSGVVPGIDFTDSSKLAFLSQVGIKTDDLDHLVIDDSTLTDALKSRFSDVKDLFVPSGSGAYTFVTASGNTQGGIYDTQVTGGVLQMRLQGSTGAWTSLTQSGGFATGPSGTTLDGLLLNTGTLVDGFVGTMRIAIGVAQRVATNAATYTEFSTNGLIFNENRSIETQDKEIQKQVDDLEERIAKKEKDLKAKFVKLEVLLAKLQGQQNYLGQQLSNLSRGWKTH